MGPVIPALLGLLVAMAPPKDEERAEGKKSAREKRKERRANKKNERKNKKNKPEKRARTKEEKRIYEWRRTKALLEEENLELDKAPEGKRIAWVKIVREQVFRKGELFPVGLNKLHALTRERIIKRELLFDEGDMYTDVRIEETMRNLRSMGILALVRIVAIKTDKDGEVGVVVHTRDLWSLRVETSYNVTTQINYLNIALVERNVAGLNHRARLPFGLRPDVVSIGQSYGTRRTFGRAFTVGESSTLIINRAHGHVEGGTIGASAGRPFYNLAQHVAFSFSGSYGTSVRRQLANGDPQPWIPEGAEEPAGFRIWREQNISTGASLSLRGGERSRHTLTFTFFGNDRSTKPIEESGVDPAMHEAFLKEVPPVARREVGPSVSYGVFVPKFKVFTNLDTFGQSENVRLGPWFGVGVSAPLAALGSTAEALIPSINFGWTWAPGGALLKITATARGRWQTTTGWIDQLFSGSLRAATPMLGPIRIVSRVRLVKRWNDTTNVQVSLGANNGLRGFPSQHLLDYGASMLIYSAEIRTKPIEWKAIHLGFVAFYDMGSVFQTIYTAKLSHGFGIGVRMLLPQINRNPSTLDGGFSVSPFRFVPTFKSGQVFSAD